MTSAAIRPRVVCALVTVAVLSGATAASNQEAALVNHNEKSARGLAKAYGFLLGQQMTLDEIERRYSNMKAEVLVARVTFEAAFPRVFEDLEAELGVIAGIDKLPVRQEQLQSQLDAVRQPVEAKQAAEFLEKVRGRARGEGIESEVLAYLLAIRYARRPVSEFTDGFRQRFQTDGTGKALGVRLALQLPQSWLAQEGERPHIVKKWTSESGTGLSVITLDLRDTGGVTPTVEEIADLVKSGEIREMFSSMGTVLDAAPFSIERQPGVFVRLSMIQERIAIQLSSEGAMFQVFFRGKAVGIMCMTSRPELARADTASAWRLLEPLCRQVANSLVLSQVY